MVPTVDTIRYDFIVSALILKGIPVLLVGPVGTGKTSVAQNVLDKLNPTKYSMLTINMSSQVRYLPVLPFVYQHKRLSLPCLILVVRKIVSLKIIKEK